MQIIKKYLDVARIVIILAGNAMAVPCVRYRRRVDSRGVEKSARMIMDTKRAFMNSGSNELSGPATERRGTRLLLKQLAEMHCVWEHGARRIIQVSQLCDTFQWMGGRYKDGLRRTKYFAHNCTSLRQSGRCSASGTCGFTQHHWSSPGWC